MIERVPGCCIGDHVCGRCGLEIVPMGGKGLDGYESLAARAAVVGWRHLHPRHDDTCTSRPVEPALVILVEAGDVWHRGNQVRRVFAVQDRCGRSVGSTRWDGTHSRIVWGRPDAERGSQLAYLQAWEKWAGGGEWSSSDARIGAEAVREPRG